MWEVRTGKYCNFRLPPLISRFLYAVTRTYVRVEDLVGCNLRASSTKYFNSSELYPMTYVLDFVT